MKAIRLSRKTAESLLAFCRDGLFVEKAAVEELRRALQSKLKKSLGLKRKPAKKRSKKEETAAIRREVMTRANGYCEHCGKDAMDLHMDHFFGRVRVKQSARNCWALCRSCHRSKTDNKPNATYWLWNFAAHAWKRGYPEEASMAERRAEALELSRGQKAVAP